MAKFSVSVIIASYNRKNLLEENLEALDNQKFKGGLEIIVVDDGSSDGTREMLEAKAAVKNKFVFKYFKTCHQGPAAARNLGIANALGGILIFLDDDSVAQNGDYVQKMAESFKGKETGIVAGRTIDFYPGILNLAWVGVPPEVDFDNPSKFKETIGVPTKNAAFLKEAVLKAGGFNPIFKYAQCEDIDLCIRILNLGYKLGFNEEALVYHYPPYKFGAYVKKLYYRGYSWGIFRSLHPDKSQKFSLFKALIFPVPATKAFVKKAGECYSRKLFNKSFLKEITQLFILFNASYGALSLGEIKYQLKKYFISAKIRLRALADLCRYFFELKKHYIKAILPFRRKTFLLYLTNKCNQRCRHCFFSQEINKNIQELSLEDLRKIAASSKLLAKTISQGFTGGEPFLRDDLLDIISLFKKEGVRNFQINTNGMLTDKIVNLAVKLLEQNVSFKIIISIDGLEKTHDKIRNTPGAFRKAVWTIKKLKEMGANVGTIMTINRLNYREIGKVESFLNENFGIEPGLQLIRSVSQSNAPSETRGSAEPLAKNILITRDIIPELRSGLRRLYFGKTAERPLKTAEYARKLTYLESHLDILESEKKIFDCEAGKSVGVIYQNGDVSLCEFYKPIGNLKEADFDLSALWGNLLAQRQRRFIRNCYCNHDCFINTEYNLRFARHFLSNLGEGVASALKNLKFN